MQPTNVRTGNQPAEEGQAEGGINDILYREIYTTGAGAPKLYGLPKGHKTDILPQPNSIQQGHYNI